jgi:transaldolase
MPSQLESLKKHTVVVADTGDIEAITNTGPKTHHQPVAVVEGGADAAVPRAGGAAAPTRPSSPAIARSRPRPSWTARGQLRLRDLEDHPGRVSNEVDASYSFDTPARSKRRAA